MATTLDDFDHGRLVQFLQSDLARDMIASLDGDNELLRQVVKTALRGVRLGDFDISDREELRGMIDTARKQRP